MSTPQIQFSPKHPGQKRVAELWDKSQALVITGPAGTGKTSISLALALQRSKKVMLCRPSVSVDEDLGFEPSTLDEKIAPWLSPFTDVLGDMSETRQIYKWRNIETVAIGRLGAGRLSTVPSLSTKHKTQPTLSLNPP